MSEFYIGYLPKAPVGNRTVYQKGCRWSGSFRFGRRDDFGLVANAVRPIDL